MSSPTIPKCDATPKNVTKERHVNISVPKIVYKDVPVTVNIIRERLAYKRINKTVTKIVEEVKVNKKNRMVEVPKYKDKITYVRVVEVPVPVDIIQEEVVFKTINQTVERRVEVPRITATKRKVEVPVYNVIIKEVPKIEIIQRVVEVVREELEVLPSDEAVDLLEEKLVENMTETVKQVGIVREVGLERPEAVEVPQIEVVLKSTEVTKSVPVTRQVNVTQEIVDAEEEIETVEKIVEVIVEQEQVVEVPKIVTKFVNKEVILTTVRERIQEVPVHKTIELVNEVPETEFINLPVELRREQLVPEAKRSSVPIVQEQVTSKEVASKVSIKNLVPKPYAIHEEVASAFQGQASSAAKHSSATACKNDEIVLEVIVADYQEEKQVYAREVLTTVTTFKDVEVPIVDIQEEVVKITREHEEEVRIEVPKIYEVEKVIEVQDADCEDSVLERQPGGNSEQESEVAINHTFTDTSLAAISSSHLSVSSSNAQGLRSESGLPKSSQYRHLQNSRLLIARRTRETKHGRHKSERVRGRKKLNCTGMRIQKKEVTVPKVTKRVIEVPVYRVVEKVVEVPVERTVEEIEEVPVVVDLERIVEVTQVEYNDTVVEKVVKRKIDSTFQQARTVRRDVVARVDREVLQINEQEVTVPLKAQYTQSVRRQMSIGQEVTQPVLTLTDHTRHENVTKKVKLKKRVEKLVPKTVTKIKPKLVEVTRTIIQERVVPVYHEKEIVKLVEVETYTVSQKNVTRKLTWQTAYATQVSFNTTVALESQEGVVTVKQKEVEVLTGAPSVQTQSVPIAVPCSPASGSSGTDDASLSHVDRS